ncbi:hypothetical protein Tco_0594435, partial [Tanacetum coccineum]
MLSFIYCEDQWLGRPYNWRNAATHRQAIFAEVAAAISHFESVT